MNPSETQRRRASSGEPGDCNGDALSEASSVEKPNVGTQVETDQLQVRASRLNEFHEKNWQRMHEAFPPSHPLGELVLCVQEEVGELAAAVLGVTGAKKRKAHLTNDDVLDAVADAMTYLSLVAHSAGCTDLEKLLFDTFDMVSERAECSIKMK